MSKALRKAAKGGDRTSTNDMGFGLPYELQTPVFKVYLTSPLQSRRHLKPACPKGSLDLLPDICSSCSFPHIFKWPLCSF